MRLLATAAALSILGAVACSESTSDSTGRDDVGPLQGGYPDTEPSDADAAPFEGGGPCNGTTLDTGVASIDAPPLQSFCSPGAANPPDCPSSAPVAGDPCVTSSLRCVFDAGSFLDTFVCNETSHWTESPAFCTASWCDGVDAGSLPADLDVPCGSQPDIPCDPNGDLTDVERANARFDAIAECCGALNENKVVVRLDHGCAASIAFADDRPETVAFEHCIASMIAGRRFECATTDAACVSRAWSTVK